MRINLQIIKELNPCLDRLENFSWHYRKFDGTVAEFLDLENITHKDKLWVLLGLLPRNLVEIFAIDCAVTTHAAAYAADAALQLEHRRQIEVLVYLVNTME